MSKTAVSLTWDMSKINGIQNKTMKGLIQMGNDMAARARANAPYRTGALSNSIRVEENAGTVEVIAGGKYSNKDLPYAAAVEFGHRQKVGKFVPGYWSGNTFIYKKYCGTGMVLKKPFVKGSHYMERAMNQIMSGNYLQKYFGEIV